jgi:hypothetical protein
MQLRINTCLTAVPGVRVAENRDDVTRNEESSVDVCRRLGIALCRVAVVADNDVPTVTGAAVDAD